MKKPAMIMKLFCKTTTNLWIKSLLILALLGVTSACSSGRRTDLNNYDTDASADFAALKTYRWNFSGLGKTVPTGGHTREFNHVVCEHVDMLMNDLGYARAGKGKADFTLDYRVVVTQEEAVENDTPASIDNNNYSEANNYGLRWTFEGKELPSFKGLQAPKDQAILYQRGELHIAAINQQGQVIWHRSATKILDGRKNEAERRAALRIAVEKIMASFPKKQ